LNFWEYFLKFGSLDNVYSKISDAVILKKNWHSPFWKL